MHKLFTALKDLAATVAALFPARSPWRFPALLLLTPVLWPPGAAAAFQEPPPLFFFQVVHMGYAALLFVAFGAGLWALTKKRGRPPKVGLLLVAMLALGCWAAERAFAQALTPIVTIAGNIATVLTGPFAIAVATIGLVACGFLAMSGRMPWSAAIAVIAGIVLIFGAATIVNEISTVARN